MFLPSKTYAAVVNQSFPKKSRLIPKNTNFTDLKRSLGISAGKLQRVSFCCFVPFAFSSFCESFGCRCEMLDSVSELCSDLS